MEIITINPMRDIVRAILIHPTAQKQKLRTKYNETTLRRIIYRCFELQAIRMVENGDIVNLPKGMGSFKMIDIVHTKKVVNFDATRKYRAAHPEDSDRKIYFMDETIPYVDFEHKTRCYVPNWHVYSFFSSKIIRKIIYNARKNHKLVTYEHKRLY